jgi:hypothetical protein
VFNLRWTSSGCGIRYRGSRKYNKADPGAEILQQAINFLMGHADGFDIFELEQLVAVANLYVCETFFEIILQRIEIDGLIVREFVRPGVVPAVYVAEEYQAVVIGKLDPLGILKDSCQ